MGNWAVQLLKLVLTPFRVSCISFVQIETSSPLFTVSSDASEIMRPYSQHHFIEESEILQNTMKSFQSIFRVLCNMHICQYQFV